MLIESVKRSLSKLPPFKKGVVGVSGGADSVALAYVLNKLGYEVVIAHLNHGLRGEASDADEALVKALAKQWKVPFESRRIEGSKAEKGNRENRLRQVRYGFLEKIRQRHKADVVAVAHHRDDQVETILMHLSRGAGLRGIRGMLPMEGHLIRPLLGVPKSELVAFLEKEGIPFRTDESNFDLSLRRNHFRHRIIPVLRKEWPTLERDLVALAEWARRETAEVESSARRWIGQNKVRDRFACRSFLGLPDPVQSEVLFQLIGRQDVYRKSIEQAKALVKKGVTGKRKKLGSWVFQVQYGHVVLHRKKAPEFVPDRPVPIEGRTQWGNWELENRGARGLFVRSWKPGDRFQPSGMRGSKKLQDFFVDLKIPKSERHRTPIIVDEKNRILAISTLRVARNAGYLKKVLRITPIV
jgi:tRNA(Ile)-lysidine synthase